MFTECFTEWFRSRQRLAEVWAAEAEGRAAALEKKLQQYNA
jgi:hypothetical protein